MAESASKPKTWLLPAPFLAKQLPLTLPTRVATHSSMLMRATLHSGVTHHAYVAVTTRGSVGRLGLVHFLPSARKDQ